jgi:hypothetical protein
MVYALQASATSVAGVINFQEASTVLGRQWTVRRGFYLFYLVTCFGVSRFQIAQNDKKVNKCIRADTVLRCPATPSAYDINEPQLD